MNLKWKLGRKSKIQKIQSKSADSIFASEKSFKSTAYIVIKISTIFNGETQII